ncbi:hypothetical protein SprV_0200923500 [Sparganum proliferum]
MASAALRNVRNDTPKVNSRKLPPKSKRKKSTKSPSRPHPNSSGRKTGVSKFPQESVSDETMSQLKPTRRSSASKNASRATALSEIRSVSSREKKTKKQTVVLKSLTRVPTSPNDGSPPAKRVLRQKSEHLPTKVSEKCPITSRSRRRSVVLPVSSDHPTSVGEAQAVATGEKPEAAPETVQQKPVDQPKESDPYEISEDENCPPTTMAAPKPRPKRKFFSKGRAERLKQSTFSAFNFFRGKFRVEARKPLRNLPAAPLTLREEHQRIAATTIWLPVPDTSRRPPANTTAGSARGGVLYSTPVSGATAAGGPFAMLSSKPMVALRGTDVHAASLLASPILPSKPSLSEPVVVVTATTADMVCNTWSQREEALPSPMPLVPSPPQSPTLPPCPEGAVVRASPPSAPRPSHSAEKSLSTKSRSQRSSMHSPTPRSTSSRGHSSHEEDVSNYKEWLDVFNAQLEPYEDFNLTID